MSMFSHHYLIYNRLLSKYWGGGRIGTDSCWVTHPSTEVRFYTKDSAKAVIKGILRNHEFAIIVEDE